MESLKRMRSSTSKDDIQYKPRGRPLKEKGDAALDVGLRMDLV
jgi:hypothetical protein